MGSVMADRTMTFEVASPPEEVFGHVADLTRLPEWDSSVRDARLVCDTGPAFGRRYAVRTASTRGLIAALVRNGVDITSARERRFA